MLPAVGRHLKYHQVTTHASLVACACVHPHQVHRHSDLDLGPSSHLSSNQPNPKQYFTFFHCFCLYNLNLISGITHVHLFAQRRDIRRIGVWEGYCTLLSYDLLQLEKEAGTLFRGGLLLDGWWKDGCRCIPRTLSSKIPDFHVLIIG